MIEFHIRSDIYAVKFRSRMNRAYMRPHGGTLAKMMLAVRTFKSLKCSAFILIMSYHVTSMFVGTRTIQARISLLFVQLNRSSRFCVPAASFRI